MSDPRKLMPQALRRRVESLNSRPLFAPSVGVGAGLVLSAAAYLLDSVMPAPPELVRTETAEFFLSAVVGSTITVTALLFWIRGMIVQLAARQMSNRVLRWYLEDTFLLRSISFLIAVFAYATLQLLLLPAPEEGPAPPIGIVLAVVLILAALLSIVGAITNSVAATDPGMVLRKLADEARDSIRTYHPPVDQPAEPQTDGLIDARELTPQVQFNVVAQRTGWVAELDGRGLINALPAPSMLEVMVRPGSFVPEGHVLATATLNEDLDSTAEPEELDRRLRRQFNISVRRRAGQDVEFSLRKIADVATQTTTAEETDTISAFEAVNHLGVALRELFVRQLPPTHLVGPDSRQVLMQADLGYGDFLRRTFGQIREAAQGSLPVLGTLVTVLGDLQEELAQEARDERLNAIEREAERLLATIRATPALQEERSQVLRLAAAQGWHVPEESVDDEEEAAEQPAPSSPEDTYQPSEQQTRSDHDESTTGSPVAKTAGASDG